MKINMNKNKKNNKDIYFMKNSNFLKRNKIKLSQKIKNLLIICKNNILDFSLYPISK